MGKNKICKCGAEFEPVKRPNSTIKSNKCFKCLASGQRKKDWINERKYLKEKTLTKTDWLDALQVIFNTYIRERDKNDNCISCGKTSNRYDAGHYYAVGNYSALRFNEDNTNKQCSFYCNKSLHGNFHEYTIRLKQKIGEERVKWLEEHRHDTLEISIEEIKEQMKVYKVKIAELKLSTL